MTEIDYQRVQYTSERLTLTNQLIELQSWAQNEDTKRHIEVILERLWVLDGFERDIIK